MDINNKIKKSLCIGSIVNDCYCFGLMGQNLIIKHETLGVVGRNQKEFLSTGVRK